MTMGIACAVVSTYLFALEPLGGTVSARLGRIVVLGWLGAAVVSTPLFITWAAFDLLAPKCPTDEAFKTLVIALLGFLVFEALRRLAQADSKDNYLSAFLTVLTGVLIAMAVETWPRAGAKP